MRIALVVIVRALAAAVLMATSPDEAAARFEFCDDPISGRCLGDGDGASSMSVTLMVSPEEQPMDGAWRRRQRSGTTT